MYNKLVQRLREHNGWALNETLDQAADAIENTSKAYEMMAEAYEAEVTKSYWIPVTERLPEEKDYYLVYAHGVVGTAYYGSKWWTEDTRIYEQQITYWMPMLPEPTEEET